MHKDKQLICNFPRVSSTSPSAITSGNVDVTFRVSPYLRDVTSVAFQYLLSLYNSKARQIEWRCDDVFRVSEDVFDRHVFFFIQVKRGRVVMGLPVLWLRLCLKRARR